MAPQFRNYTPFPGMAFESWGKAEEKWTTVVLKGTFAIRAGGPMKAVPEQADIVLAPEYWGDPVTSSMRFDSDLAPHKPAADIHVIGSAKAPGRAPTARWGVMVEVGSVRKTAVVCGPRIWQRGMLGGWSMTEPVPVLEVPLRYEFAFGGTWGEGRSATVCEWNPIGRGFRTGLLGDGTAIAPQIESPRHPITSPNDSGFPEGFGPCSPAWLMRRRHAGTYDKNWLETRWPGIPNDFDFRFYNSAHPTLVADRHLVGDERFALHGFHHSKVEASLPGIWPYSLLRLRSGTLSLAPLKLDTLVFDVDRDLAMLTWRGRVPIDLDVRVIEARAKWPGEARHG